MLQMVIEAAGGRVTEDAAQATARTIVLAGEKDLSGYSTSKAKKPPWSPATEVQKKDFLKISILTNSLDRQKFRASIS
jgi:hypothetical protein